MIPIQIFQPKFRKKEILEEISQCLDKGWTGMGFKTEEFEKEWNEYTGLDNSHFLSSNTVGLHLSLKLLKEEHGWKDGDEIITTPLTFVSTNHSILYENLTPVFADVDDYLCLDPNSILQNITKRTKAVIFVGMGGNPGQLDKVEEICKSNNLKLILDAAHMSGTFVLRNGKKEHVGREADVAVFSFQAVKNLPTADSGMICFKSKKLDFKARKYSWLGIDKDTYSRSNSKGNYSWKYDVPFVGYKYHGNSIMASIAKVQLRYLDTDNQIRNTISEKYLEFIDEVPSLEYIKTSEYCEVPSRHLFQIYSKDDSINRDAIIEGLHNSGIYPGVHYIDNRTYRMFRQHEDFCKRATFYSNRIISLPLHLNLSEEDIIRICNSLREITTKNV